MRINLQLESDIEYLDEKCRDELNAFIAKLKKRQDREYWAFIRRTAKEVKKWPAWKRGDA